MEQVPRRAVLRLLGVSGVAISAGCLSVPVFGDNENNEFGDHNPGALVMRNMHSLPYVVYVSVTVPKSVEMENVSRDVRSIILSGGLETQIPIIPGETKVYPDFLSGSVKYTITAWRGAPETEGAAETPSDTKVDCSCIIGIKIHISYLNFVDDYA